MFKEFILKQKGFVRCASWAVEWYIVYIKSVFLSVHMSVSVIYY